MTCNCGNEIVMEGEIAWHKCLKPQWYWNFTPILKPHREIGGIWVVWSDEIDADQKYSHDLDMKSLRFQQSPSSVKPKKPSTKRRIKLKPGYLGNYSTFSGWKKAMLKRLRATKL